MFNGKLSAIYEGLIRLLYEETFIEVGEIWKGTEAFNVEKRVIIKMPCKEDEYEYDHGYELFTTTIGECSYIGVHRLYFGEYGERLGTVDGLIQFYPEHKYITVQRIPKALYELIGGNCDEWS